MSKGKTVVKWYAKLDGNEVLATALEVEHRPNIGDYHIPDQDALTDEQWKVTGAFAAFDESLMFDTELEALRGLLRRIDADGDTARDAYDALMRRVNQERRSVVHSIREKGGVAW